MPCNSSDGMGDAYREDPQARRRIQFLEALLCGLLSHHDAAGSLHHILTQVNWSEAGLTPQQALAWYDEHRKRDGLRIHIKTERP